MIPLLNPPTVERFLRGDRFSELPDPIRSPFPMEVQLPAGYSKAKAWMLSNEPRTAIVPLTTTVEKDTAAFEVPALRMFRVIVMEFEK